ncbi:MAG TPA: IclR family transcriptional regulator [Candidatus Limnocylindrales bacterium]|nr:IclR family transcriptional regulator [Candidatus Limnocylindrales bacterium]
MYNLSVSKALSIINLLAEQEDCLSLTQISTALGLSLSTTHHLISSLKMERYVEQNQSNKKYGIGLRLFEISLSNNYYQLLAKIAGPVLENMSDETGESSNLAVLIDGQITYIAQRHSSQMMKTFVQLGKRSPVHCTGVGKVLISELSEEAIEQIVKKHGLIKYTANTITSLEGLKEELEKVKINQYAIDQEEREDGVVCIAAPVFSSTKKITAAISISGPTSRIKEKDLPRFIELLKKHTQYLSHIQ